MTDRVYVVCEDDGTGVPAGVYIVLQDALFDTQNYNPDIALFIFGQKKPAWVYSREEIVNLMRGTHGLPVKF